MRRFRRTGRVVLAAVIALAAASGCQTSARRRVASAAEPGLSDPVEPGASVVEVTPPATAAAPAWVDRHPLFSKPRQYYEKTGRNKVAKVAAATVIGIPAGLFGELRQIVSGAPAQPRL